MDKFLCRFVYNDIRDYTGTVNFAVDHSYKRSLFHRHRSKVLCVIIPHWRERSSVSLRLRHWLLRCKISCVFYHIKPNILLLDYEKTKEDFLYIRNSIRADIKVLKEKHNFEKVIIVGLSLGNVPTLMIANDNNDINDIILVCPGNILADSLWNGIRTSHLKEKYIKHGINLDALEKSWRDLDPENNISKLKNQKTYILLSRADQVIPFHLGLKLFNEIKQRSKVSLSLNRFLGHYLTILKFTIYPKEIFQAVRD